MSSGVEKSAVALAVACSRYPPKKFSEVAETRFCGNFDGGTKDSVHVCRRKIESESLFRFKPHKNFNASPQE
jgi:hypothetical protein